MFVGDVEQAVGLGKTSLFRDGFIGHGGALMSVMNALVWPTTFYGAEMDRIKHTSLSLEAKEITVEVISHNEQFK